MATTSHLRVTDRSVFMWTAGIAAVWIIAAVMRSNSTLHLGPLLVPLVPALLGRDADNRVRLALFGIATGAAAIALLSITGNLDGPALEPFSTALVESIVALGVGGAIALAISVSSGRRTR